MVPDDSAPKQRRGVVIAIAVAAVMVVVVGTLGGSLVSESSRRSEVGAVVSSANRTLRMKPASDFEGRGTIYLARDKAALVLDNVPTAGAGRSYQLWSIRNGVPSSMAVFAANGRIVRVIAWTKGGDFFAVTREPKGGSARPTTAPLLVSA